MQETIERPTPSVPGKRDASMSPGTVIPIARWKGHGGPTSFRRPARRSNVMTAILKAPVGPDDHVTGPADAPITLVEYGDFECPYCGAAHPIVKSVIARMEGQLRFVYRHFPLTEIHPHAEPAAEISEVAAEQGHFWRMHDLLFEHQDALEDEDLVAYAVHLGIPLTHARRALREHAFAGVVRRHFLGGVHSGVNGTPTFFINGVRHDGAWDEAALLDAIHSAAFTTGRR
jgi:protein-disulfide isomerase